MNVTDSMFRKYGYIEGWLSIIGNILLFVLKMWVGILTGSIAITVDAWHSLSDSLTSIVVIVGTRISLKPADKEHPFGHGRAELIGSIIIGILLSIVAVNFFYESCLQFIERREVRFGTIAIIAMVVTIIMKELLAQYAVWAGKKIDSKSLIADGWHHRSDALSSVIILIGIFLGRYFWWIDSVLGIIVSLMIGHIVLKIMKSTVSSLIGEKADDDLIMKLRSLSKSVYPEDIRLHHIHLHKYGRHAELTFHIELPDNMDLKSAHDIASNFEDIIKKELRIEATIHTEPNGRLQ